MADNTVRVGSGKQKRKARWPFLVALAAVVVLSIGAGVFVRWAVDRGKESVDIPKRLPEALEEVQFLELQGKQAEADQKIAQALQDPTTPDDVKFTLYTQQGANFFEKGEYQNALASYQKAFEIRSTFEVAQAIASVYQQLGDKQQAISYMRRAIELMPQDNPVREDDIAIIEEQIKMLESGQ